MDICYKSRLHHLQIIKNLDPFEIISFFDYLSVYLLRIIYRNVLSFINCQIYSSISK